MIWEAWIAVVYWVVAFIFMIATWVDNQRVHYIFGEPSPFWSGILWPLFVVWLLVQWVMLLIDAIRRSLSALNPTKG